MHRRGSQLPPESPEVVAARLRSFEIEHGLSLPESYRRFLVASATVETEMVDELLTYWKSSEIKCVPDLIEAGVQYVEFVDCSIRCWVLSIRFRDGIAGRIYYNDSGFCVQIFESFDEFPFAVADPSFDLVDRFNERFVAANGK